MKVTKTFIRVFLATFLIGHSSFFLLNLRESEETFYPIYVANTEHFQTATRINEEKIVSSDEVDFKPKVFEVDGFWDKLENQHNKHLLEIGEVSNGEDFKVRSGEIWLGLYGQNEKAQLRSTKIRVQRTDSSDLSWKVISAKAGEKPLFLVKNLKNVKAEKVKTVFRVSTRQEADGGNNELTILKKDFYKEFKLGEKIFILRVEEGVTEKQEPILVLLLEHETRSQIVHYIYYSGEGDYVGNLYWAGDLDSDGTLDLFMDFWGYEKGGYSSGLFLSSEAEKGKLVKLFEYFALSGC